jgi:transcriptional regulator with XRE-family HTH domain
VKQKGKPDPFLVAVCEAVHQRRGQLGISQEELAQRAGLHRTYISDIERGARNPTLKTLSRLAVALEISASRLIRMAESSRPEICAQKTGEVAVG